VWVEDGGVGPRQRMRERAYKAIPKLLVGWRARVDQRRSGNHIYVLVQLRLAGIQTSRHTSQSTFACRRRNRLGIPLRPSP